MQKAILANIFDEKKQKSKFFSRKIGEFLQWHQ